MVATPRRRSARALGLERDTIDHYRANMAHIRQAWPYSGRGFQEKVLNSFNMFSPRSVAVPRIFRV